MREQEGFPAVPFDAAQPSSVEENHVAQWRQAVGRRSFLKWRGGAVAVLLPGSSMFASQARAASGALTGGDVAILRFLAAAELIEADLWQQYNELGGIQDAEVPGGSGSPPYVSALEVLDEDMSQYIHDNTDDEISHFTFINAYLSSR